MLIFDFEGDPRGSARQFPLCHKDCGTTLAEVQSKIACSSIPGEFSDLPSQEIHQIVSFRRISCLLRGLREAPFPERPSVCRLDRWWGEIPWLPCRYSSTP